MSDLISGLDTDAETLIEGLIDAQAVVAPPNDPADSVLPDSVHLDALVIDLANGIYEFSAIAARYGLTMRQLHKLASNPVFARMVKEKKALIHSDQGALERFSNLCAVSATQVLPSITKRVTDPSIAPALQLEYFKHLTKCGNLEPQRAGAGSGMTGPGVAQFAVNIFLGDKTEHISTTVITAPVVTLEGIVEPAL